MPPADKPNRLTADFARMIAVLVQNAGPVVAVVLVAVIAAFGYALIRSAVYDVGAQLIVKVGSEIAASPSVSLRNTPAMPIGIGIENVNNEVQIMRDPSIVVATVDALGADFFLAEEEPRTLLQRLKRRARDAVGAAVALVEAAQVRLGLREPLTPLEKVVVALQEALTISAVPQSYVIELSLRTGDRDSGETILARFIDTYLAKRQSIYEPGEVASFFETQRRPVEERLEAREAAHAAAKERLGAFSVGEQRTLLLRQEAEVKEALDAAAARAERLSRELAEIDARLGILPARNVLSEVEARSPVADEARRQLLLLEVRLAEATRSGGQAGREAETLRDQIDLLRTRADAEAEFRLEQRTTGTNAVREDLVRQREATSREAVGVEAEIAALRRQAGEIAERLGAMERAGLELVRIEREVEQLDLERTRLIQALSESRVARELASARISNVSVAAAPMASLTPAGPKLSFLLGVAAVLSLGLAGLVLVLLEMIWPRVRLPADLAAVLGEDVPLMELRSVRRLSA